MRQVFMQQVMHQAIWGLSLIAGLAVFTTPAAFAQQTTIRTGPNGNSTTTTRTLGDHQQQTVRTGPNGNSQTTTRTWGNNQQQTVRTGPLGNTQTTTRTWHR